MNTVNIIEQLDDTILQLVAFPDNEEGNNKAEQLFRDLMIENCQNNDIPDNDYIDECIDSGFYWDENSYHLYLVHSTNET
jgi:hypothetical protein